MEQILDFDQISFDQLEACAFNLLRHAFCEVLKGVLEHMDAALLASRDSARYQPKDIRSRKLESLLGEIEIRPGTTGIVRSRSTWRFWTAC
jgi:hypothetical protein